jgi:hypothetical protein
MGTIHPIRYGLQTLESTHLINSWWAMPILPIAGPMMACQTLMLANPGHDLTIFMAAEYASLFCPTELPTYALGGRQFQAEIEQALGRRAVKGKAGRPKAQLERFGGWLSLS